MQNPYLAYDVGKWHRYRECAQEFAITCVVMHCVDQSAALPCEGSGDL